MMPSYSEAVRHDQNFLNEVHHLLIKDSIISRNKTNGGFRKRVNEILFIDARNMGFLVNRKNRELSEDDIALIAGTYHNWRATPDTATGKYEDVAGFCKVASIDEVRKLNYVLSQGRYVGLADEEDDFNFEERFNSLKVELEMQIVEEAELNKRIAENLNKIIIKK